MYHSHNVQQMMAQNSAAFDMMQANVRQNQSYQGFAYGAQDPYGTQMSMNVGQGAASIGKGVLAGAGAATFIAGFGSSAMAQGVARLDPFMAGMHGFGTSARAAVGLGARESLWQFGKQAVSSGNFGMLGRAAVGGVMGAALSAAPVMAAWSAARYTAGQIAQGGREEAGMQQMIARNFDFYNPMARSGRGFDTGQMSTITDSIRSIADKDPFTDLSQLMKVFNDLSQKGMLLNATNPREVASKFKQTTDTLRDIAKVVGTTMEGALQFFDESRKLGFTTKSDVLANVRNQIVGAGGGLSSRGIAAAQMEGSQMAQAQGYGMREGAILASKSIQSVRDLYTKGMISESDLRDMSGGAVGEQAYATVGRTLQQAAYNLSHSGVGRVIYAGLAEKDEEGKFTGRLNQGLLEQFRSGQLSAGDLKQMASKNLRGRAAALSFLNMEKDIAGEFAAGAGPEGWGGVMSAIQSMRPGLSKDAVKLLMKKMTGLGRREVETIMKLYETMDQRILDAKDRTANLLIKKREEAEVAQNFSVQGLWTQFKHSVHSVTGAPLGRMGANLYNRAQGAFLSYRDKLLGRTMSATMTQEDSDILVRQSMGMSTDAASLSGQGALVSSIQGGALTNMGYVQRGEYAARLGEDRTGMMAGAFSWAFGKGAVGRQRGMAGFVGGGGMQLFQHMSNKEAVEAHHNLTTVVNEGLAMKVSDTVRAQYQAQLRSLSAAEALQLDTVTGDSAQERAAKKAVLAREMFERRGWTIAGIDDMRAGVQKTAAYRGLEARYGRDAAGRADMARATDTLIHQRLLQETRFKEEGVGLGSMKELLASGAQKYQDDARERLGASLTAQRSVWKNVVGGAAAGATVGMGIGAALGAFAGWIPGMILGGAKGTVLGGLVGAGAGLLRTLQDHYTPAQIAESLRSDKPFRDAISIASKGGPAALREAYESLRASGRSPEELKKMYAVLENASNLQGAERTKFIAALQKYDVGGAFKRLEMYRMQMREGAEDLLGVRDQGKEMLGGEMYERLYGKEGLVEQMRRPKDAVEMGASIASLGTLQHQTIQELAKRLDTEGMSGKTAQFLRKTTQGQRLLSATRFSTKEGTATIEKLMDSSGGDTATLAASLAQRFNLDKKSLDKNMLGDMLASGDVGRLQQYLQNTKGGPRQETTVSLLTQIKSGTDRMAKAAEVMVDVMMNAKGNEPAAKKYKGYSAQISKMNSTDGPDAVAGDKKGGK